MLNRTEVRWRACGDVSGIDARLDKRCWVLSGDILPGSRPVDMLAVSPGPLAGLAAGANTGSEPLLTAFLPRFSLTLRPSPGLPNAFTGELAFARSGPLVVFFPPLTLPDLRASPCVFPD